MSFLHAASSIKNSKYQVIKVKNVKNRSCPPFVQSEGLQLLFANGINPVAGLLSLLVQDERIEKTTGNGRYVVKPEFCGEKPEYVFQASKARNDINVDVLLDNPKLMDAASREEAEEYLKPYMAALELINSDVVKEKDIVSEEGDTAEYDNAGSTDE